ncbi:MAG: ComEC/Rec2 family competence protein [Pyrinomonadaceae bacterium]
MALQVGVNFLDVGQGDGTLISTPTGELILIDLGSKKNAEIAGADAIKTVTAAIIASMNFRHSDVPLLNRLLLTHGDGDHYNLITQLLGYVRIMTGQDLTLNEVAIGGRKADYDQELQNALLNPAEAAGRLTTFGNSYHDPMAANGTVTATWPNLAGGAAKLYLLSANYPYRDWGPKNPKSLVVMLSYVNASQNVILTGDAEGVTEAAILGYYATNLAFLESFGLKLGHHGSQAGTSVEWIETVQQLASFASADMKWAHPYCETIARITETIGPGAALYNHNWLCGAGAGEGKLYRNWRNNNGFYTTMAFMTHSPMQDPEDGKWYSPGFVQGVQYQLSLYDNGLMQLVDTLGGNSGVFDPARAVLGKGFEVVAPSIETEGFRLPLEMRPNPQLALLPTGETRS